MALFIYEMCAIHCMNDHSPRTYSLVLVGIVEGIVLGGI